MKQKKFKFSLGLKIATILSCVALVSMGFASWWIVSIKNNDGAQAGSFTVYEVEEKEVEVTVDSWENETIVYGTSKKTPATTPTWLLAADSGMLPENLVATLTFTVSATENLDKLIGNVDVTFVPNTDSKTMFDNAIAAGYISAPVINASYKTATAATATDIYSDPATQNKDFTYNSSELKVSLPAEALVDGSVTVTVTFNFGWGAMTNGENPYDYFNTTTYDEEYSNDNFTFAGINGDKTNKAAALNMLATVKNLGSAGYNVVINAAVKSAA